MYAMIAANDIKNARKDGARVSFELYFVMQAIYFTTA